MSMAAATPALRQIAWRFRPPVSRCAVDADGVSAEWVEATVAKSDQPTLVYFSPLPHCKNYPAEARPVAADLAIATGARVLTVGFHVGRSRGDFSAVEDGLTVWRWLLGEGCDSHTTAFIAGPVKGARAVAVLYEARRRGLQLPALGAWFCDTISVTPTAPNHDDVRSQLIGLGALEQSH